MRARAQISPSVRRWLLIGAGLIFSLLVVTTWLWLERACEMPSRRLVMKGFGGAGGGGAVGCFEFWLSRYQTLITGTISAVVATGAAILVLRQLRLMDSSRAIEAQEVLIRRLRELHEIETRAADLRRRVDNTIATGILTDEEVVDRHFEAMISSIGGLLHVLAESEKFFTPAADHLTGGPFVAPNLYNLANNLRAEMTRLRGGSRILQQNMPLLNARPTGEMRDLLNGVVESRDGVCANISHLAQMLIAKVDYERGRLFASIKDLEEKVRA